MVDLDKWGEGWEYDDIKLAKKKLDKIRHLLSRKHRMVPPVSLPLQQSPFQCCRVGIRWIRRRESSQGESAMRRRRRNPRWPPKTAPCSRPRTGQRDPSDV